MTAKRKLTMSIRLSAIEHLGKNLYSNAVPVKLAEAIGDTILQSRNTAA
jgi:hypothetical protein